MTCIYLSLPIYSGVRCVLCRHVTRITHTIYCPHFSFFERFIYTVCVFKTVGCRIFAVCAEQLYKRGREREKESETEIKGEILGAILDRYECEKDNRSGRTEVLQKPPGREKQS